jgi:hypothetical protein
VVDGCATRHRVLQRACAIEPDEADPQIELVKLLGRTRQRAKARAILDRLAGRTSGRNRRRALGARFRISPGPISLARWLGAFFGG